MELLNPTEMEADFTVGIDPDGRERLVVIVKGTFRIDWEEPGAEPELADEQVPLTADSEYSGKPGVSALVYESDLTPMKPRCDVLLNGSAYAPGGKPTPRVTVGLRLGSMEKSFDVVGDRVWEGGLLLIKPGSPEPFEVLPISYDKAYGGEDVSEKDPEKKRVYRKNPVGVGFFPLTSGKAIVGKPLSNTEETGKPVKSQTGKYRPMAFGPIGCHFEPRVAFAGTYNQKWQDNVCPLLPADFDPRYYQSTPPDQQIEYPRGGEEVLLINLTASGRASFRLPSREVPVEFSRRAQQTTEKAVLDTVIIEPDASRLLLVWRASMPLRRNLSEVTQVIVGRSSSEIFVLRD